MEARSLLGFLLLSLLVLVVIVHSLSPTSTAARFTSRLPTYLQLCPLPSSRGSSYDCYPGKCVCSENIANCSHNNGSLSYVPSLNSSIHVLDLSDNNLTTISGDFFANVTGITYLVLSYNPVVHISHGAFGALIRLEVLIMENCNLTEALDMEPVFEGYTLKCVNLRFGVLQALPDNLYNTSTLENLFLFYNHLGDLNLSRFEALPSLRLLQWSSNHMTNLVQDYVRNLEILLLNFNELFYFPDMCSTAGAPLLPRLYSLSLRRNLISVVPSKICLPGLLELDLSENLIKTLEPNMFGGTRFPNLTYLYVDKLNNLIQSVQNYTFNNSRLWKLSLMFNNIDFTREDIVQSDSFAGCLDLCILEIGSNMLFGLTDERFHLLFGHLTGIEEISMFKSSLQTITVHTFAPFPRLKILRLYLNNLAKIPDGTFTGNPWLEILDLNDNRISTIKSSTFTDENHRHLKHLDISGNPFVCDCELRWFSEWLIRDSAIFSSVYGSYHCSDRPVKVASFSMPEQACMLSRGQSELIAVSVSIVLLGATLFSSVFRFRWHIRLLLYEAFRGNEEARRRRLEEGRFDYDVFVSYASEDNRWVLDRLMPELEGRLGLSLCVYERDFIPGKNIVDNIADCVTQSKKILMVFSRDFVRSQWCQFELSYCLRHVIENDDALIAVCLGDVASRDLTSAMMAVMKTTVYLQWLEDDGDALASFWGRLKMALREVTPVDQH